MDVEFLDNVLQLYREKNWREILKLNKKSDNIQAQKLLWVWPSEKNLDFIKKVVIELNLRGIVSIGCGCGLLEWIIRTSTDLPVIGYEVNKDWWESKYSNPTFIKLQYCTQSFNEISLPSDYALMFCYFNDDVAFFKYIQAYSGNMVIIIGPGKGRGCYSNPEPFNVNFRDLSWRLYDYEEVKNSRDFIAVYIR